MGSGKWAKSPDSITCEGFDIRPQIPQMPHICIGHLNAAFPTFLAPKTSFMEDKFSTDSEGRGGGFRIIQAHYIYCALYFYYYHISSTSGHQALDPRGWGPLSQRKTYHEQQAQRRSASFSGSGALSAVKEQRKTRVHRDSRRAGGRAGRQGTSWHLQ